MLRSFGANKRLPEHGTYCGNHIEDQGWTATLPKSTRGESRTMDDAFVMVEAKGNLLITNEVMNIYDATVGLYARLSYTHAHSCRIRRSVYIYQFTTI